MYLILKYFQTIEGRELLDENLFNTTLIICSESPQQNTNQGFYCIGAVC